MHWKTLWNLFQAIGNLLNEPESVRWKPCTWESLGEEDNSMGFYRQSVRFVNAIFQPASSVFTNPSPLPSSSCEREGKRCSLTETGWNDGVEEVSEEGEPFGLLDFAITILVEAVKELLDLGLLGLLAGAIGKTITLVSELHNLISVNLTVAVDVELCECSFGLSESSLTSLSNVILIGLW